jgi:2-methylcitrate dehydratase PrpD
VIDMVTVLEQFAATVTDSGAGAENLLALHLLDTLGAYYAGGDTEETRVLRGLVAPVPGVPPALDGGMLDTLAYRIAVIRNTEIDDIHMESCVTPGSVVIPVALTLSAALGKPDPKSFARALAAGYEAMTRLSLAVSGATILYRGVWPTFFTAPVGAATVASVLLGLDSAGTTDALSMALMLTSGATGGHGGASPRWIMLGQAARAGVFSALAAAKGMRGDTGLLDGEWLQRTHGIACDPAFLVAPIEGAGAIATISYKPWCSAKQGMAAIDGFRRVLQQTSVDSLKSVKVAVPPAYAGMIGHGNAAKGRIERITGATYQLALAAFQPAMLEDVLRPDLTRDANIAAFMPRVEILADPALSTYFPSRYPARLEATLHDGSVLTELVTDAVGDPMLTLSPAELRTKFHRYADVAIGKSAAAELAAAAIAAVSDAKALTAVLAAFAR